MNAEGKSLTPVMIQQGLKRMGKHPLTLRHAFLELALRDKDLQNIDLITEYPHLMYLDVSNNGIESLQALGKLPSLVELDASHNSLSACLDFAARLCDAENPSHDGHFSAGSLLTFANLSYNCIPKLIDLSLHRFLEKLDLSNNQIVTIEGLQGLNFLKHLDLSYNKIKQITGLDGLPIQELKLRGNQIKFLDGLDKLPKLVHLDVGENMIASLAPLAVHHNLNFLDVSKNCVEYIRQTEFLRSIPWLTHLIMEGNPAAEKDLYRLRVLFRLPKLLVLDTSEATLEDKVRAFNLYHAKEGDLAMREEVLLNYVPQAEFVDHAPQQLPVDEEDAITPRDLQRGISCRPIVTELANKLYEGVFHEMG